MERGGEESGAGGDRVTSGGAEQQMLPCVPQQALPPSSSGIFNTRARVLCVVISAELLVYGSSHEGKTKEFKK